MYNIPRSSLNVMMQAMIDFINHWISEPPHAVASQMVTASTRDHLRTIETYFGQTYSERTKQGRPDIECIVLYATSRGHPPASKTMRRAEKETMDMKTGRKDYRLSVNEKFMEMANSHLLLKEKDGDWHTPLFATITSVDEGVTSEDEESPKRQKSEVRTRSGPYTGYAASSSSRPSQSYSLSLKKGQT